MTNRKNILTTCKNFIANNDYDGLLNYIDESNSDDIGTIDIELFSICAFNDNLLDFLLNLQERAVNDKKYEDFYVGDIGVYADVMISSCMYDAKALKWIINKMKENNIDPIVVIKQARGMFGCGELEELAVTLMKLVVDN
jgi:hypothetical protein